MLHLKTRRLAAGMALSACLACSDPPAKETPPPQAAQPAPPAAVPPASTEPATDPNDTLPPPPPPSLPEELSRLVDQTFTGDHDGMIKRRLIRVGVPFNRTFYFVDKGTPRGLSYEYALRRETE
jgi:hypothetical protein